MITESISFSGMVVALLCMLLLFSKKNKKNYDHYLILWLLICIANLSYYTFPNLLPVSLQSFGFTLPVLSVSILYLYVMSMTFGIKFQFGYILKHALFFIFYNIVFVMISHFYEKIVFVDNIPYFSTQKNNVLINVLTLPMAEVPVLYIVFCFLALKKYQKLLPDYYSTLEKINLNWFRYIILSLVILLFIVIGIISFGTKLDTIPKHYIFKIVGALQAVYLFWIVFFSLRQSIIVDQNISVNENKEKVILPDGNLISLSQNLQNYMISEKPYLNEELSLSALSMSLGLSTNQLSQVINQTLNTNFYKFVNAYRIEAVKEKLKDNAYDRYSLLGIAYDYGFNSKSTFNKIFKEETGMTPSEYKRLYKQN